MHPDLEAHLLHCRNLPSPPAVALRIIELAQDPGADLNATAQAIGVTIEDDVLAKAVVLE